MKSNNYIIAFLVLTMILSSCGSLSVSRMRYTRGINISLFDKKNAATEEKQAKLAVKKQAGTSNSIADNNKENTIVAESELPVGYTESKIQISENRISSTLDSRRDGPSKKPSFIKSIKTLKNTLSESKSSSQQVSKNSISQTLLNKTSGDSDVALLILVILALIIPPLAVYLFYGSINTQFWISLILTLIAIGAFAGAIWFGWAIPVIHALLVIFGVFG